MGAGRPPIFDTPENLQRKIDEYFEWIQGEYNDVYNETLGQEERAYARRSEPATITGLCYFLGFESRQSFHDYADKAEFSYTIKIARLRIEYAYEIALHNSKNPTGQIFALKNLGWSDKQEVEHSGKLVNINITPSPDCEPLDATTGHSG